MSLASVDVIMDRIRYAEPFSPIAVFFVQGDENLLDAVFASTARSQRLINLAYGLVGVFDRTMNLKQVHDLLCASLMIQGEETDEEMVDGRHPLAGPDVPTDKPVECVANNNDDENTMQ